MVARRCQRRRPTLCVMRCAMSMTELCTFKRDGIVCGRPEGDKSVHVAEDERMRRGAHVWRYEPVKPKGQRPEHIDEVRAKAMIMRTMNRVPPHRRAAV